MRLIDADALRETLGINGKADTCNGCKYNDRYYYCNTDKAPRFSYVCECIDDAPTIDAVPVRHGRWKFIRDEGDGNSLYECSECGRGDIQCPEVDVPYCWHCGARMDAERKEE